MKKYLKLLEEMAKVLHYKKISWDKIEMYYYPKGLSTKFAEEETIRKIQIENGKKAIDANNSSCDASASLPPILACARLFNSSLENKNSDV